MEDIYFSNYKIVKPINLGLYSSIYIGYETKTMTPRVLKIFNRKKITDNNMLKYLDTELRLSTMLDHPNLVKIYEIVYQQDYIGIVMEYLQNGNILEYMETRNNLTIKDGAFFGFKITQALNYLHLRGVVHRDIKPENIVLDGDNNPKLIDYGFSKEGGLKSGTYCGTLNYMAPEIVKCNTYDAFKADVWSLGVTLHVLLLHVLPYDYTSDAKLIKDIRDNTFEVHVLISGPLGKIISKCLEIDPEKRPSVSEVLLELQDVVSHYGLLSNEATQSEKKVMLPKLQLNASQDQTKGQTGRAMINKPVIKLAPRLKKMRITSRN